MRTCLSIAVVILLAPLSVPAQLDQSINKPNTSEAAKSNKTHKATAYGTKKAAHHSRKIGTGENVDNSHPQVFGDDLGTSKPKPKP